MESYMCEVESKFGAKGTLGWVGLQLLQGMDEDSLGDLLMFRPNNV